MINHLFLKILFNSNNVYFNIKKKKTKKLNKILVTRQIISLIYKSINQINNIIKSDNFIKFYIKNN